MEIKKIQSAIESILFATGSPVTINSMSQILEVDKKALETILEKMLSQYNDDERGITLLKLGDAYQLVSNKRNAQYVKKALDNRKETFLSTAAFEVLAIIAYNQPVTRGYVSQVRGVECGEIMEKLEEKELIEECGKLDAPGRPRIFRTTTEFLRVFGLSSLSDLPILDNVITDARQLDMSEVEP